MLKWIARCLTWLLEKHPTEERLYKLKNPTLSSTL